MDGTTTLNPAPMPRPVEDLILPALDSGRYFLCVAYIAPDPKTPGMNLVVPRCLTVDFPWPDFPAVVAHMKEFMSGEIQRLNSKLVPAVPVVPVVDESPSEPVADGDAYLVHLLAPRGEVEPPEGYDCRGQDVTNCHSCGGDHEDLVFRKSTAGSGDHYWANCPSTGEIIGLRITRISDHTTLFKGTVGPAWGDEADRLHEARVGMERMYSDLPLEA